VNYGLASNIPVSIAPQHSPLKRLDFRLSIGEKAMVHKGWTALLAGAAALSISAPAVAHHSHAMFDHEKLLTVTGTVMNFAYVNPHGELNVAVEGKKGELVKYWFEMSNLTQMVGRGIRMNTFKPGDKITVHYHPLKDRRVGGSYTSIVAADGHVFE
jgi:hypothetical protein